MHNKFLLFLTLLAFSSITKAQNFSFPVPGPSRTGCADKTLPGKVLDITKAPFNADPKGKKDATEAFRAAVAENNSFIYVPNGTYLLSNSVIWRPVMDNGGYGGNQIIMWGESRDGVILKLKDNAEGYSNTSSPKELLSTGYGGSPNRFNNSIHNLTIDVGKGNPGAIGLRHYCNNLGGLYNLKIYAPQGSGWIGLDKSHSRANGPNLTKDVLIDGFNTGIRTDYSVESEVFEHVTLQNQKQYGFYNLKQILSIRDLKIINCGGPAFTNESGHVVLLDCNFNGKGVDAIVNGASGKLLVRNFESTGYSKSINDPQKPVTTASIKEYTTDLVIGRNGKPIVATTLNLPIKETPVIPWDDPKTTPWVNVEDFDATTDANCGPTPNPCFPCDDDGPRLQAAIDATLPGGSRAGATTLFMPGSYRLLSTVRIRGSIRRIIATGRITGGSYSGKLPDGSPTPTNFIIEGGTYPAIEFQHLNSGFSSTGGCSTGCRGVTYIQNTSGRTLILKNSALSSMVVEGGEVFIESCSGNRDAEFTFKNAKVWARQFDPERDAAKVVLDGSSFWCLGLKTEGYGEIIVAKNNSKVELFGGFIYSVHPSGDKGGMFRIENSQASLNFFEYTGRYGSPYMILVEDITKGKKATIGRGADSPGYPTAPPVQQPKFPSTWSQRNDLTGTAPEYVVGSNLVLYVNKQETKKP
ncbi:MAG TPA: glycosyl hydrolase family 28-related protein [Pedobacter sp.]